MEGEKTCLTLYHFFKVSLLTILVCRKSNDVLMIFFFIIEFAHVEK
jgi:hypothetical protein